VSGWCGYGRDDCAIFIVFCLTDSQTLLIGNTSNTFEENEGQGLRDEVGYDSEFDYYELNVLLSSASVAAVKR
jgi:hypothetical protein